MPIKTCTVNGRSGFKWGNGGACYTHDGSETGKKAARKRAIKQAVAIGGGKMPRENAETPWWRSDTTRTVPKKREYALETVDLEGVEIAAAGVTVYGGGSPPGGDNYSVAELERIAAASNAVAEDLRPPVKVGHDRKQRLLRASGLWGEEPRTGTLKNFRVAGEKLVCDIKDMPKKLADLVPTAFRLRSMELGPARSQRTDETYDTVVKGLALLGATAPAFQTLDDIHAMYAGEDREPTARLIFKDEHVGEDPDVFTVYAVGDVVWDEETGVNDIMEDIRAAINPSLEGAMEPSYARFWVRDYDPDGPRVLIGEYGNGAAWVAPVTFGDDREPTVPPPDEWVLAEQAWIQAAPDSSDEAPAENFESSDTTGIVKVKLNVNGEEREVELPDLDENQVKLFAEMYGLEGDDVTAERVYETMADRAVAEQPTPPTPPTPAPSPTPPAPAPPPPDTGRTMSDQEFAELRDRAERGDRAYEQLRVDRRDSYLQGLVKGGRINPADVQEWTRSYDENEQLTRRLLDKLPVQEDLLRVYGADNDGLDYSESDEALYRAYCANQGIPYIGGRA